MRDIRVPPLGAGRIAAGYPHVLRDWLGGRDAGARAGEVAAIVDSRGQFLASAFAEADERIAYRIFSRQPRNRYGEEEVLSRLAAARELRSTFIDPAATDAYRLVNAEADGIPGLGIDVYGPYVSLQLYSRGLAAHLDAVCDALRQTLAPRGIFLTDRSSGPRASRSAEAVGKRVRGDSPPSGFTVREAGVRFVVDLAGGYNTGLFLDNRENRLALRAHVRGRRVLNLFSYTGSISVHAALAGADAVTSVDVSEKVQLWARKNFELNGLDPEQHPLLQADALEYLRKGSHRGSRHDVIVLDPPSFSTSKRNVFAAEKDYPALVSLALEVLSPGGTLVACSNLRRASSERFLSELADIARRQRRPLKLLDFRGAGADFPIDLAYPEAAYLKFAILSAP